MPTRLLNADDFLHVLLDMMPENIYFKDKQGKFIHVSLSLARFYGVDDPKKVIGKTDADFYSAEHAAEYRRDEEEVMRLDRAMIEKEERCIDGLGQERNYLTTKVPIHDRAGNVIGIAGVSHDITARKLSEAASRQSELRFRRLFESDMIGIHFWDADGNVTEANDAYLKMLGYTRKDLAMKRVRWREITPPEFAPLDDRALVQMRESGSCPPFEKEYVRKNGSRIPILLGAALLPDSQHEGVAFAIDLSKRRKAEQELNRQRREQEIILDSVPALIWYKDSDNRIIRANKAGAASAGMTKDQMEGRSTYELYPEFAAHYYRDDMEVINSGQPKMGIVEGLELLGGGKRWVRTDKIPYRNDQGRIVGVIVFSTDITDLKETEAALRKSEERFRSLAENSSVGIWRITTDGHTLYANPAMCRMLQVQGAGDLRGKTFHDFFTPDSLAVMKREHAMRNRGVASTYEAEITGLRGQRRNVLISGSPLLNPDGSLESMIGTFTDITDRKQAEVALRREQQLLQVLMDHMPDAIYFKDRESRIMRTNVAHARIMGIANPREAIGRSDSDFFPPDDAAAFRADEVAVMESGQPLVNRIECHSGTPAAPRWWSTSKVPIRDSNNEIVGLAGITREITQLKNAEEQIRRLNDELEQRVADRTAKLEAMNQRLHAEIAERRQAEKQIRTYQDRLKSLASELTLTEERERRRIAVDLHDQIGQTLAFIQIKLQAMRETTPNGTLASGLDECVQLIRQPIQDTRSLVFNLSPPVLYDLGLEAAVAWVVDQHQGRQGLRITLEGDEQPKPLEQVVAVLLFRAIRELLTNVVKHSKGRSARVWMRTGSGQLQVGVQDDGLGFAAPIHGAYAETTSGFGLFSIREQLDRIGGQMEIDSSPGRGCHIILTVPMQTATTNRGA